MTPGLEMVIKERMEQIEKHGYDKAHDQKRTFGVMTNAAVSIITCDPKIWPWEPEMIEKIIVRKPRTEQLAIASALIVAEIDRLTA